MKYVNNLYIGFAVIHLFNAFQFMGSWLPLGFGLCSVVQIPEILNVVGASLYLWSASLYDKQDIYSYQDDITMQVHRIETAAASIEIIAALGWVVTWWLTYPRGQLGRGWTLDDPDSWANVFIVVPSIFYVAYNAQILADTTQYGANTLYITGDILYCAGSFFYLFASMRDDGWWWCMPGAGACALGCDAVTPIDPSRFESEAAGYGKFEGGASRRNACSCCPHAVASCLCGVWAGPGTGFSASDRVDVCCARFKRKAEAQGLLRK